MVRYVIILNRLSKQDPAHVPIDRVTINDENEVSVILNKSVDKDKVPEVMRSTVERMAQEFPEEDLTVVAYAASEPSRKLGKTHRDAKTKEIAYTPEAN